MTEETSQCRPEKEPQVETDVHLLAEELIKATDYCTETTLRELERLRVKTEESYTAALEQIESNVAVWHSLLDEKEVELRQTVEDTRASKLSAFTEREALFTAQINLAKKLVADSASEELQAQGPSLLSSLSSPLSPHPSHLTAHPGLGFCSNITDYLAKALSMGMWVSGEDVKVGERATVSAVGGLQSNGTFWVRQVTANAWSVEYALQFISDALFEVPQSSDPLEHCSPGQLCVGRFSQDGRWYRAVVTSLPRPGVAKYFFVDHGGSEEAPLSSLYPLPDPFRALPFQMIHVRLTSDPSIDFNTREMRWSFTDSTHNKQLVADILGESEVDEAGPVYLIHLEDHTQEQPFDVGKMLITAAQIKEPALKFKSRDVRFKEKRQELGETPSNDVVPSSQQENSVQKPTDQQTEPDSIEMGGATEDVAPPLPTPSPHGTGSPNSQLSVQTESSSIPHFNTTPNDNDGDSPGSIPVAGSDSILPTEKESQTGTKPGPLQLGEVEGVLRNAHVSNGDAVGEDEVEVVESIHPSVRIGERLEVEVVTELSADGSFWCQLLLSNEGSPSYDRLQEDLQAAGGGRGEGEAFTPVFYHERELCTALFSEDGHWYRARIERVCPGAPLTTFTVRYIDFGNSEDRQQHELMPLGSKFKLLPPRAIHCSVATTDHVSFTKAESEKFDDLTSREGISVEVLAVEEEGFQPVSVRLLRTLPDGEPVDLTGQILGAGVKPVPRRQWSSSTDLETPTIGHVADWASHMEDMPDDPVFLTLPGHESSRETTPLARGATPTNDITFSQREATPTRQKATNQLPDSKPTPTSKREATPRETTPIIQREATPTSKGKATPFIQRESTPTIQRETTPTIQREATPTSKGKATPSIQRETTPTIQREATPTIQREATPTIQRETTPTIQRETTPTIQPTQQETTRQQGTASPVAMVTSARSVTPHREATPTQSEATPTQWAPLQAERTSTNFLQRVPPGNREFSRPRQSKLDLGKARQSILSSLGGPRTVPRLLRHNDTDGSPNLRSRVRQKQDFANPHGGKLYVKCPAENFTDSKIKELFGRYGDVLDFDPHTTDPSIVYVTMNVKGAEEVVTNLNGYETSPGHHLVVEKYRMRSPSPPPPHPPSGSSLSDLTGVEHIKLFVKNMSTDHSLAHLKTVFSRYGKVLKMLPDPKRKNITYIFMDTEGGAKAVNNLHGKAISKNGKPLVVEPSYDQRNR